MKAIKIYCCSCNNLKEVIHVDGEGTDEVQGDVCDRCFEAEKQNKKTWQKPKLNVVVNSNHDFNKMMNDHKVATKKGKR